MNIKDVQNHLDFVRWPPKIHPTTCLSASMVSLSMIYFWPWFLCNTVGSTADISVSKGGTKTAKGEDGWTSDCTLRWCKLTRIPFHSPKKTCTIFKKSTILQSTHHDQLEASKYQWRFKTYQGRISSFFLPREAKSWDSWLQDAPLDMLQGQLGYGSEHAPAGHVPHGLLLCIWETMWSDFQSQNHEVTTTSQEISPHGAILHSALLPKTWASWKHNISTVWPL